MREYFVCTSPAPPPPHKFSNGPSLNQNRYGTYLVHIKFRVLKCHSLDIRIETFHGSLIRQWEVNSIHQLFFSVVCQLLSKHILATFCDNDVARSCNYFLNTNCDTLLFYFFCNNTSFAKTNSMNRARKISTSSFPRSKIFKNRLAEGILTDPRIDTSYVYSVGYIISNQLKGKPFFREVNSGNKRQDREGNNIFSMCKISFNLVLGVFLWLNASCSYIHRCMYMMRFDKNSECLYLSKEYN